MSDDIKVALITGILGLIGIMLPLIYNQFKKNNNTNLIERYVFPDLKQHIIHDNIDIYIRSARNINSSHMSEGRNQLVSDFMVYLLTTWKQPCEKFAEEAQHCIEACQTDCNSCNKIYSLAMDLFAEGMKYESLIGLNVSNEDEEVVRLFKDYYIKCNYEKVERLTRKISDISLINDIYKDCSFKSARILEAIDDFLYGAVRDGIFVIKQMSELDGKTYKGKPL